MRCLAQGNSNFSTKSAVRMQKLAQSGCTLLDEMKQLERSLLDAAKAAVTRYGADAGIETIFILGAPRTGSTLTYQAVCSRFGLPYIANFTNDYFSSIPIVGLALQKTISVDVAFGSHFGKTDGPFQPSEGSRLMVHWFGTGDPPALKAATIRAGLKQHFVDTIRAAAAIFAGPLVIKNAWNCYRVPCLARTLPAARFIWIRRDIADAAKSDLGARYKTKGNPKISNRLCLQISSSSGGSRPPYRSSKISAPSIRQSGRGSNVSPKIVGWRFGMRIFSTIRIEN